MAFIGVVGAGYWGKNHVRTFAELGTLAAVCDVSERVRAHVAEQYAHLVRICSSFRAFTNIFFHCTDRQKQSSGHWRFV